MNVTIIVSAAEAYEKATDIAIIRLPNPPKQTQCLDSEQRRTLFEKMLPLAKAASIELDYLYLQYFTDGEPQIKEAWTTKQKDSLEPDSVMELSNGRKMWRYYAVPVTLPIISL